MVSTDDVKRDYLFRGNLDEIDPDIAELIRHETARQAQYLIMIPSESTVPRAVRETLSSPFHNIYAEGYPLTSTRNLPVSDILDYNTRLPEYRRYSDERYYKGTEYANIVEALARRRAAEVFAANGFDPEDLYVNVQPLSGAPANNAVYTALLKVGDTVMGMDLIEGGHLTHGSPVNRSGKFFNIVSYGINPDTGKIDYERMAALAQEHRPRMIIGGYSSYPWQPDWERYREIADSVGAYLLADVAHVAGLVAAGMYPSPIGIADVVTFTTHKTLQGPRGAVVITHKRLLASKIDRGVFPGEQGGPHVNQMAALAVALKLAKTEQFHELQERTVANAKRLAHRLEERGLTIAYKGTDTHLLNIDTRSITGADGTFLSGDMAARILELAGVVCNRQTVPGDTSALRPSGVRLGTPWITQRGFGEVEIDALAEIIADVLLACEPYSLEGRRRPKLRAKIDHTTLQDARLRVRDLAASVGIDTDVAADGYPHFHYLDDDEYNADNWDTFTIRGGKARAFLHTVLTNDLYSLRDDTTQATNLLKPDGSLMARAMVEHNLDGGYLLHVDRNAGEIAAWLRALSDGRTLFEPGDPYMRVPGPVDIVHLGAAVAPDAEDQSDGFAERKAYHIGAHGDAYIGPVDDPLPRFEWEEPQRDALMTTTLHTLHREMGAKMVPFAGYDMPVWYTSVSDEHNAVRNGSGIFDVTHMGVFEFIGTGAMPFLDAVTTNDLSTLKIGESHYTYLLDVDGQPFDDLMIYRLARDRYLAVVNASNNDKNWAWLRAVRNGDVMIDAEHPWRRVEGATHFVMRDLRQRSAGDDMRVDIALQGPKSKEILLSLDGLEEDKAAVAALKWADVTTAHLGGFDMIVSRTGYTGERTAYEIFVHPDAAPALFKALVESGVTPCGLAARDSLRTEAGLPLYGHELAGPLSLNPADAGFGNYVKIYKPFFVGRRAYIQHEATHDAEVVRFRLDNKGARPPHTGDPLMDAKGRVAGIVTSCSIDSEGYQLGQAYVKLDYANEGVQLGVYTGVDRLKVPTGDTVKLGARFSVPDTVTILSRFPRRKRK